MGRKVAIFFMICIMIFVFPVERGYGATDLVDILDGEGLEFKEAYIDGWAKSRVTCQDNKNLELLAQRICDFMDVDFSLCWIETESSSKKIIINSSYEKGNIEVCVENMYSSVLKSYETLISISITQHIKPQNIINIRDKVDECLSHYGSGPPVSMCIICYREGELRGRERHHIIYSILAGLDAVGNDSIEYGNLISVTGYSKHISQFVKSNNKRININIACRYSSSDERTYYWIGTPVINVEY